RNSSGKCGALSQASCDPSCDAADVVGEAQATQATARDLLPRNVRQSRHNAIVGIEEAVDFESGFLQDASQIASNKRREVCRKVLVGERGEVPSQRQRQQRAKAFVV